MLKTALQAGLPLIICTTSDTLHAESVIKYLSGQGKVIVVKKGGSKLQAVGAKITVAFGLLPQKAKQLIEKAEVGNTLVLVNPEEPVPEAFNAGEIPVPERLVRLKLEREYKVVPACITPLMASLGGLTLKEVDEVARLAQASTHELTPESVRTVRTYTTHVVPGVRAVNTDFDHYFAHTGLTDWFTQSGPFLTKAGVDWRLRPRGLLCTGRPGTGKTLGSKWLSRALGVPLFRLDVGSVMSKYVGESEGNLRRALEVIEHNAPCVMLVDEVEKLFHGSDDSGVTQNLLAGLLWWLQEHRVQVLTVMTTNDTKKLPEELIRPGRLDGKIEFGSLHDGEIDVYVDQLLTTFGLEAGHMDLHYNSTQEIEHARLTAQIIEQVRKHMLTNGDG
jgi:hypothetical protein